jgi:hypothetical protein
MRAMKPSMVSLIDSTVKVRHLGMCMNKDAFWSFAGNNRHASNDRPDTRRSEKDIWDTERADRSARARCDAA